MKRYLLFIYGTEDGDEARGGAHDLAGDFDNVASARRHYDDRGPSWHDAHVLDTGTGELISFAGSPPCAVFTPAAARPAGLRFLIDYDAPVRPLPPELRDAIARGLHRFTEAHPE